MENKNIRIKRNSIQDIKKPMLERLISQTLKNKDAPKFIKDDKEEPYVKQISSLVYEELRSYISTFVENMCRQLTVLANHQNTKIITKDMVSMVLTEVPLSYGDLPMCEVKDTTAYKQKKKDCLYIDKNAIKNLFIEKGNDFLVGIQFDDKAMQLLHISCERYIRELCFNASLVSRNRKKRTLWPADLQMASRLTFRTRDDFNSPSYMNEHVQNSIGRLKSVVSFDKSIDLILKEYKSDRVLPKDFIDQLNMFLNVVSKTIILVSYRISKTPRNRTIKARDILYAIDYFLPGELRKHAHVNIKKDTPIHFNKNTVKKLDHSSNLDEESITYLTRLLEYLTMEIIYMGHDNLHEIFENDDELETFLHRLEVYTLRL